MCGGGTNGQLPQVASTDRRQRSAPAKVLTVIILGQCHPSRQQTAVADRLRTSSAGTEFRLPYGFQVPGRGRVPPRGALNVGENTGSRSGKAATRFRNAASRWLSGGAGLDVSRHIISRTATWRLAPRS